MTPTPALRALAAALAAAALACAPAHARPAPPATVAGEVIVGLHDGASATTRAAVERRAGVDIGPALTPRGGVRLARVAPGGTVAAALTRLAADPAVRWAEPNRVHHALALPGDPLFGAQWGLLNTGQDVLGFAGAPGADIGATAAWDVTTGSDRVRVAVVDGGVDHTSADLSPNIGVVNPGESGGGRESNGVDDDGNGLVDDWRGWDFVDDDGDPMDESAVRHGTTVAGIIGARGGDGTGIAGVSWTSRIIPVRGLDASGAGTTADLAAAITYASSMGARVLNASFGGPRSDAIAEAIAAAPQMLVVAAAGNGGDGGIGEDNEAAGRVYPCSLPLENVVCVAATGQSDELAGFSNVGRTRVDLGAPGVRILSPPRPGSPVTGPSGTSFAAPHVAGVAALVLAREPSASTRQIRRAVLEGAEPLPSLDGAVATGARLDAPGALAAIPAPGPGPGGATGPATDLGPDAARLTGTVPGSAEPLAYHFEHGPTAAYGSWTATRLVPPGDPRAVTEDLRGLPPGTALHHRVVVHAIGGVTFGADAVSRQPAPPAPAAAPAAAPGRRVAARPTARVRRIGRTWFVSLTLRERVVVSALLQRRRPAVARRAGAWATVRGVRRRGLPAGVRRLSLGRPAPGPHRVRVRVTVPRGTVTLTRTFVVPRR